MIDWTELHRLNRVWRQWMDAHSQFATPTQLDNLRYARIEANEAADLWMRERLPAHARNNERNHTIPGELAQVVMLTLTALPEIDLHMITAVETERLYRSELEPIDWVCSLANDAVEDYMLSIGYWQVESASLLYAIAAYPGVNVEQDLRQCWWSLAWKHASYHMAQYPKELQPNGQN